MSIPMLVLGALVGWCGTRGPRPPLPKEGIIGIVGGMVAVAALSFGLGYSAAPSAAEIVVLSVAAYAGGRFLNDVVNIVLGSPARN